MFPLPDPTLILLLQLAGAGQLVLATASLLIPRMLRWPEKLALLDPLLRRVFWVYAVYILGTNLALGLVSLLATGALVAGGPLAAAILFYAAVYWGGRLAVQFTLFRGLKPEGAFYQLADLALSALFLFLTAVYLMASVNAYS